MWVNISFKAWTTDVTSPMKTPGKRREVQRCKTITATSQWLPDMGAKAHEMWDWVWEAENGEYWTLWTTWGFTVNEMENFESLKEVRWNDLMIL